MATQQSQTITIDGIVLTLLITRRRVKKINARLRDSVLRISAPPTVPQAMLDKIIPDLARRLVRRARAQQVNAEEDALALANRVADRFPERPQIQKVQFVTTQQARWGSYSMATGTIRLHAALREMPRWVLEAVVAHELAHIRHPNHSGDFRELLRQVFPDVDRAESFLAGVAWLGQHWHRLPPIERSLLIHSPDDAHTS